MQGYLNHDILVLLSGEKPVLNVRIPAEKLKKTAQKI